MKLGLIAGNGKFPFLVIEGARKAGKQVAVAAIREETDPEIERLADSLTWVGIGQLGKMLRFFKDEGVKQAIMAGQVKHVQIFSSAIPDVRMLKMLLRLPRRNTDALIGAVATELASEGIELIDSTHFLKDQLPQPGVLTAPRPVHLIDRALSHPPGQLVDLDLVPDLQEQEIGPQRLRAAQPGALRGIAQHRAEIRVGVHGLHVPQRPARQHDR